MSTGSIVQESADEIDTDTSHAIAAAQLRGESRVESAEPRVVVRAIAEELEGIGLHPDVPELERRYEAGDPELPSFMRQDEAEAS